MMRAMNDAKIPRRRALFGIAGVLAALMSSLGAFSEPEDPVAIKFAAVQIRIEEEIASQSLSEAEAGLQRSKLTFIQDIYNRGHPNNAILFHIDGLLRRQNSPELRAAWEEVRVAVVGRQELQARKAEEEFEAVVKKVSDAVLKAESASDLAPVLQELQRVQLETARRPGMIGNNSQIREISEMTNALQQWGFILTALSEGNARGMKFNLANVQAIFSKLFPGKIPEDFFDTRLQASFQKQEKLAEREIESAMQAIPAAQTPQEARAIDEKLDTVFRRLGSEGENATALHKKMQSVRNAASRWASFLEAAQRERLGQAFSDLKALDQGTSGNAWRLPEATLAAKRRELQDIAAKRAEEALEVAARGLQVATSEDRIRDIIQSLETPASNLTSSSLDSPALLDRLRAAQRIGILCADAARMREEGQYDQALESLEKAATLNRASGFLPQGAFVARLAEFQKQQDQAVSEEIAEGLAWDKKNGQAIGEKISNLATAPELSAFLLDFQALQQSAPQSRRDQLARLQADLGNVVSLWSAADLGSPVQEFSSSRGSQHPWEKQVSALTAKIVRNAMATRLKAPELLEPPYDAMETNEAVMKLAAKEAENENWRRVFVLLSAHTSMQRFNPATSVEFSQAAAAISDYLAAQNFESAEQWPEAVQSYKGVLRRFGDLVPTKQAAERLRLLKQQHPEAFVASSESAPRGAP